MSCFDDCNGNGVCTSYPYASTDDDGNEVTRWVTPYCSCNDSFFGAFCQYECLNGTVGVDEETGDTWCLCNPCYSGHTCDVECSTYGSCVDEVCDCPEDLGWRGDNCELRGCPYLETTGADCSGHGACQTLDAETFVCLCDLGWNGTSCNIASCPDDCNDRGDCLTNAVVPYCSCSDGWYGESCELQCFGTVQPDEDGGDECVCSGCRHGANCEIICNDLGICVDDTCDCTNSTTQLNHGFWGDYCTDDGCPGSNGYECSDVTATSGLSDLCSRDTMECACVPGFSGIACQEFYCGDGSLPQCNGHGTCTLDAIDLDAETVVQEVRFPIFYYLTCIHRILK